MFGRAFQGGLRFEIEIGGVFCGGRAWDGTVLSLWSAGGSYRRARMEMRDGVRHDLSGE